MYGLTFKFRKVVQQQKKSEMISFVSSTFTIHLRM